MEVKFTVTKEERKALVKAIGEFVGLAPVYLGAPSFRFAVGACIIDKDGVVVFAEGTSTEEIRSLLAGLTERGYTFEGDIDEIAPDTPKQDEADSTGSSHGSDDDGSGKTVEPSDSEEQTETAAYSDSGKLSIDMPLHGFTATALDNLEKLIAAKAWIIKKMTDAEELPIERDEETLRFPWFKHDSSPAEIEAYSHLITRLCETVKEKQRVMAAERGLADGDNEKFKARCFLLSLGFIGPEYAQARKVLLTPMSGSGSFKSATQKKPSAQSGAKVADSGGESGEAVQVREGAEPAVNAGNAASPPRCGGCEHHCYYTDGLMRTQTGDIVDTSKREPGSYTHYCLRVPSGYRKIKHAVDWTGYETAPKWCPLYAVSDNGDAPESGDNGVCRDCLAGANSLSESAAEGEEFDKLFCVVKQTYVSDDGSCGEFNS